jgi:hypothetical protein
LGGNTRRRIEAAVLARGQDLGRKEIAAPGADIERKMGKKEDVAALERGRRCTRMVGRSGVSPAGVRD